MIELPAPLTSLDCDLQDFTFMPLDVVRLRDSDLAIHVTGEEFRCAVLLWCASWHQVPAASVPDDDRTLASLAGFGRAVSEWQQHREGALRGWVKCNDGRLYHPVVAEKANEAMQAKLEQRWKTECGRIKKHNQRHGTDFAVPEFDEWLSSGCPQGQPLSVPRTEKGPEKDKTGVIGGDGKGDDQKPAESTGKGEKQHCPGDAPPLSQGQMQMSPGTRGDVPSETPSKGQGEGQGYIYKDNPLTPLPGGESPPPGKPKRERKPRTTLKTFVAACSAAGEKPISDHKPLLDYVAATGLPMEFVQLAWEVFKGEFLPKGANENRLQADWRRHFLNYVKKGYYRLWYARPAGDDGAVDYLLTTQGLQAQAALRNRQEAA